MSTDHAIELLNGRLAAAEEAGPDDVLVDVVAALEEAVTLHKGLGNTEHARILRRLADLLGADDTDLSEIDIDRLMASSDPVDLVTPEALAKHVTRSIFALKSPSPDGSQHYQSGWDDGLEAAMDAARDALMNIGDFALHPAVDARLKDDHSCADSGCSGEPGPEGE